jgi:thiol-disulfide isomerase/thioredoxin
VQGAEHGAKPPAAAVDRPEGRVTVSLFGARRHPRTALFPVEGRLPGFEGATGWLNSSPLTPGDLAGKVVLVDFWTYTCINWLRTLAFVRAWAEKYRDRGLVVIGVHTPEFPFERDVENVRKAALAMRVEYPIALDSDYAVWSAFGNRYWPAVYLADAEGRIRYHHFGEGEYDDGEWMIQHLLREAGSEGIEDELVSVSAEGLEAQADWTSLGSPETYLGYQQGQNLDSPAGVAYDEPRTYVAPESLQLNTWALAGNWTIERRSCVLNEAGGRIAFRFHARDVHLVVRSRAGTAVAFRVLLDGAAPGAAHGLDVDEEGRGTLVHPRLYQLVREPGPITDRTFEVAFLDPGVEAYVFTFG